MAHWELSIDSRALVTLALAPLLVCAVFVWRQSRVHRRSRLPPGPPGLPLIGNLLDMPQNDLSNRFSSWCKEYKSDMIYLNILGGHIIIVNNHDILVDLFEKRSSIYSSRTKSTIAVDLMGWGWSLPFMPYGDEWRAHRRLFRKAFEDTEANKLHQPHQVRATHALLHNLLDSPRDWHAHLRLQAGASIMALAYGINVLPSNDPYISVAEQGIARLAEATVPGAYLVDTFPLLKYVPAWVPGAGFQRKTQEWKKLAVELLNSPFDAVKKEIASGTATPSFTLRCLQDMDLAGDISAQETVIKNTAATVYAGGADSSVSATATFILAMTLYPDVQRRAQTELNAILGKGDLPRFGDEHRLPYLMAVVKECLRWGVVFPFSVPHTSDHDDIYRGYHIPKGTMVMPNTWAIMNDPKHFPDPSAFKPERFLSADGKIDPSVLDPEVLGFGYGRRICPGKEMAKGSLWLTAGSILATFDISKATDESGAVVEPSGEYELRVIRHPKPFECTIRVRSGEIEQMIWDISSSA
ncbi:cytochrome P450 [Athelia psychrophila]|uniref:Cytochrome P450 n=1 Tax=Athelia psychrophila TaxID=1759441 RepID=A0A166HMK5_9AGAM|nr:cytochrome P450 [Fibularhizoctonia sp. CBS 109695]